MKTFEQNIMRIYKEKGKAWLDNLPQLIKKITAQWNLTDLQPMNNLSYNYVLSGFRKKQPIILKLSPDNDRLKKEAAVLKDFAGFGAVSILNQTDGSLLLERALPGTSLKSYFPKRDKEAVEIFCEVMQRLHKAPIPQNHQFPHIADWLSKLDKDWPIPKEYLEKARALKEHLLKTSTPPVLLHGDLHHDNILSNTNDWVVIDPMGIIGEPAYETGAFIRNPMPDLLSFSNAREIISDRITQCARLLNLDSKRITEWSFVQAVLGYIWCLEDNSDSKYFADLAKVFAEII